MGYSRADSLSRQRALSLGAHRVLPAPVRPVCHPAAYFAIVIGLLLLQILVCVCHLFVLGCSEFWLVICALPDHGPGDSRRLVCHGYRRNIRVAVAGNPHDPLT